MNCTLYTWKKNPIDYEEATELNHSSRCIFIQQSIFTCCCLFSSAHRFADYWNLVLAIKSNVNHTLIKCNVIEWTKIMNYFIISLFISTAKSINANKYFFRWYDILREAKNTKNWFCWKWHEKQTEYVFKYTLCILIL